MKLWFGAAPCRSGVQSGGNGPAMRAAVFGAAIDDQEQMIRLLRAATRITHMDSQAEAGAIAVALAARLSATQISVSPSNFLTQLEGILNSESHELVQLLSEVRESVDAGETTPDFCQRRQLTTGYTYHSVPLAIHAWFRYPTDFRAAVTTVIECGGDADTNAAIIGGIVGARVGEEGILSEWLTNLKDWPRSVGWQRRLARQLNDCMQHRKTARPLRVNFAAVLLRNLFFLVVVLVHGFRRLFPPY